MKLWTAIKAFFGHASPVPVALTPRQKFIRTLMSTDFGKIICINLFRSARIQTLGSDSIRDFLDNCVTQYQANVRSRPSEEPSKLALTVATQWTTRSVMVAANEYTSPASTIEPTQFATVIDCAAVEHCAAAARVLTFSRRKLANQTEFDSVIKEWVVGDDSWTFGEGRNYFWMAKPVDSSKIPGERNAQGAARFHRDKLGLCHYGKKFRLVRVLIPATLAKTSAALLRPTAFDGIDNPAFLAASDAERAGPPTQPGTTLDLHFRIDITATLGQDEWLSKPLTVAAGAVIWDFLGAPADDALNEDPDFHRAVVSILSATTPTKDASNYLYALT